MTIAQEIHDAIVAHAKRDHPDEACGVVAGPEGSDRAERFVAMVNAAGSPTFYEFDSTDLLVRAEDVRVTCIDVHGLTIVASGGQILVMGRGSGQRVREAVDALSARKEPPSCAHSSIVNSEAGASKPLP